MENLTAILSQLGSNSQSAKSQLLDAVYEELRRMASAKLKSELPGQTLQATALVHEAWIRLLDNVGEMSGEWQNRRHFFGAAAEAMRRILIERARSKNRLKRGGPNAQRRALTDVSHVPQPFEDEVLDLHSALEHFEKEDPLRAQVVKLKFFAGLTTSEIAEITELSVATVERYWFMPAHGCTARCPRKSSNHVFIEFYESQTMPRSDEEIFSTAVEISSLEEQNRYLTSHCVDDRQRSRIAQLLSSHRELTSGAGPFVLDRTAEISESLRDGLETDCGKNIGPYRVIQLLGEGGMGLVYEAEQLEPIRRRVAVKVLKPGMDTQKVLARFELERQALSGMDHPGITRILDAGSTDTGRPYFVMELVKGIAITDYCRDYRLSALDRIHLVIQVCKAIQHAHQRGIIHRDIKPSNVLVSQVDGHPQPKIIDFGIAKLVNESIGVRGHDTYYGELIGTPAYMSPEQATSNLEGVDIRSDVYSLGVLLYELMTGETPHANATIGLVNVRKLLNESKVELPSVRLKQKSQTNADSTSDSIPDLAEQARILKGDVDCIIMRALARDPNDRFQSITELQQDLVRFVEGKPIESVPPSILYNVRKLIGRHRTLATAVFLGSFLVLIASATAVWFGIVATDATRTAETRLGEVLAMQSELLAERDRALEAEKKMRLLAQTFLAPALIHKAKARFVREHWDAVVETNQELSSLPPETRSDFSRSPELMMTLYDSNLLGGHPRMLIQDDQRWLIKILSDISQKEDSDDFLQPLLAANSRWSARTPPKPNQSWLQEARMRRSSRWTWVTLVPSQQATWFRHKRLH